MLFDWNFTDFFHKDPMDNMPVLVQLSSMSFKPFFIYDYK